MQIHTKHIPPARQADLILDLVERGAVDDKELVDRLWKNLQHRTGYSGLALIQLANERRENGLTLDWDYFNS